MLADKKIAILVANGFDENQTTEIQRALVKAQASIKIIAPETGVVNGWQGESWGHHFHIDAQIFEALGSDYDILILPGGARSAQKLKQNLHARRIINHFLDANKPIAAVGAGVSLLALSGKLGGRMVAAPDEAHGELVAAGVIVSGEAGETDGNILTLRNAEPAVWAQEALAFFEKAETLKRAA